MLTNEVRIKTSVNGNCCHSDDSKWFSRSTMAMMQFIQERFFHTKWYILQFQIRADYFNYVGLYVYLPVRLSIWKHDDWRTLYRRVTKFWIGCSLSTFWLIRINGSSTLPETFPKIFEICYFLSFYDRALHFQQFLSLHICS